MSEGGHRTTGGLVVPLRPLPSPHPISLQQQHRQHTTHLWLVVVYNQRVSQNRLMRYFHHVFVEYDSFESETATVA